MTAEPYYNLQGPQQEPCTKHCHFTTFINSLAHARGLRDQVAHSLRPAGALPCTTRVCCAPAVPCAAHLCCATCVSPLVQLPHSGFMNEGQAGFVVLLPAGTYKVSQTIEITQANVVLRGEGVSETHACGPAAACCCCHRRRSRCMPSNAQQHVHAPAEVHGPLTKAPY